MQNIVNAVKNGADQSFLSALMLHDLIDDPFDPSEEAAWLCAHCLDLPSETEGMQFSKVKSHLSSK